MPSPRDHASARPGRARAARAAFLLLALALPGCAWESWFGGGGAASLEQRGVESGAFLAPRWTTAVYAHQDRNTADIYLSDLPEEALLAEDIGALDGYAGSILHIHYFLTPKAGLTPIDFDASNVTIRHVVLVPESALGAAAVEGGFGTIGIYGGGGFLLPSGVPGDETFGGRLRDGTVRLVAAGPAFTDRIGSSTISGRVSATLDPERAARVARTMTLLMRERAPE